MSIASRTLSHPLLPTQPSNWKQRRSEKKAPLTADDIIAELVRLGSGKSFVCMPDVAKELRRRLRNVVADNGKHFLVQIPVSTTNREAVEVFGQTELLPKLEDKAILIKVITR